jgi:hypothetical protein
LLCVDVLHAANFNFCPVPGGGADALLFAAVAVALSCILYHRLSAVWVLLAGEVQDQQ